MTNLIIYEKGKINTYAVNYDKFDLKIFLEDLKNKYSYVVKEDIHNYFIKNSYEKRSSKDYEVIESNFKNTKKLHPKKNGRGFIDLEETRKYYPEIYKILLNNKFNTILKDLSKWINEEEQYDIINRKKYGFREDMTYDELSFLSKDRLMNKHKIIKDYFNLFTFTLEKSEDISHYSNKVTLLLHELESLDESAKDLKKQSREKKKRSIKSQINNLKSKIVKAKLNYNTLSMFDISLNLTKNKSK